MDTRVSFCITVYNQLRLVKECLDSIVPYRGEDIEIIVSDDCSTEDVKGLVDSYHDSRIKYFRNDINLGHDRNILKALSKAKGYYAFLLRTRDHMIPESIPYVIDVANRNTASYITGDALDQNNRKKLEYSRELYKQGRDAVDAHFSLFFHPSGNMYRLSDLNIEEFWNFLDENEVSKQGFIVHNLIRMALAYTGDFYIIRRPIWIYSDTEKAKDIAMNRSLNGVSVYDPVITEERFEHEVNWAERYIEKEEFFYIFKKLCRFYLDQVTWGFKIINSDVHNQKHYDFKKRIFKVSQERKRFRTICENHYNERMGIDRNTFRKDLNKIFFDNMTKDAVKYSVRKLTINTPFYNDIAMIYKKCFKRL